MTVTGVVGTPPCRACKRPCVSIFRRGDDGPYCSPVCLLGGGPALEIPAPGDRVLFVLATGPRKGEARPAVVVRSHNAVVVLAVFTDAAYDGVAYATCPTIVRDVRQDALRTPGSWHR